MRRFKCTDSDGAVRLPAAATHDMNTAQWIILGFGLGGFFLAFLIAMRLRHHVSRQRILELIDTPAELYRNAIPPRRVLDESGRKLAVLFYAGLAVFAGAILVLILLQDTLR